MDPVQARENSDELSPILAPLKPVKDHVTVITNTRLQNAYPGTHDTSNASFLSAAFAKHTESSDYYLGTTVDQIAAKQMGKDTQLASLAARDGSEPARRRVQQRLRVRLSELPLLVVADDAASVRGASARRIRTLIRRGRQCGRPPRGAAAIAPACWIHSPRTSRNSSSVVGAPDRVRLDQYLDSVRQVEREIERAEQAVADNKTPDLDRPVGVPAAFADHAKLMFDLQILAFQADITRVVTFQLTREQSNRTYPEIGVADPHHPTSHHGNDPEKLAKIAKINTFHVSLFSDFLQKMKATPDGDGSLLDHTVYVYGSGMGNPSLHDHEKLPMLVAGGAATGLKGSRHIRYEKGTDLANLHLTLLDRVGVHLDSFGDSTGEVQELFV